MIKLSHIAWSRAFLAARIMIGKESRETEREMYARGPCFVLQREIVGRIFWFEVGKESIYWLMVWLHWLSIHVIALRSGMGINHLKHRQEGRPI